MSIPQPNREGTNPTADPTRQSFPLQNLQLPPQGSRLQAAAIPSNPNTINGLQPPINMASSMNTAGLRIETAAPPSVESYWDQPYSARAHEPVSPESPIDPAALQYALPLGAGDHEPGFSSYHPPRADPYDEPHTPYADETRTGDYFESDAAPLTPNAQEISGSLSPQRHDTQGRDSFQTVSDLDNGASPNREGRRRGVHLDPSYGNSLDPNSHRRSRSTSSGALYRAGSIVRAISQRVVNISGEGDIVDQRPRLSRGPSYNEDQTQDQDRLSYMPDTALDTSYRSQSYPPLPTEKGSVPDFTPPPLSPYPRGGHVVQNPLKGNSLGIFSPENPIRKGLCNLLVSPWTEPLILLLIVCQAVLLAVEAAPNVFQPGNERPDRWRGHIIDWILLCLFISFTLEIVARTIVSGFVLNAAEYSTIDRQRGIRAAVVDQYRVIFQPQRQRSIKAPRPPEHSAFSRSFTFMHGQAQTVEDHQRFQLARRAFLRHGFNRLDFVAVVAFWISFVLSITGVEKARHLYIFRMLSCMRIIRLVALTNGTAIILRSLKKAAPLLVRVAFLISFFWLLFAIVGVQSFKASLSRQCVWLDPEDPTDITKSFTNQFTFCGGHFNETTGENSPWVEMVTRGDLTNLVAGSQSSKGFFCPRGSICLQQGNPYNGTVNFDNIFNSMELVFVVMSANTFSDLMYYTIDSDYPPAALFFGVGIMIMMLWMTNLMIAVITSSFQVIREESKASAFTANEENVAREPSEEDFQQPSKLQVLYTKTSAFWVLIIAFGLIIQACRSAGMGPDRIRLLNVTEIVVTVFLDIEIAIRIAANWRGFHKSYRNLFDLFLAVSTTVILLPPIRNSGRPYDWLTLFQVLRAYRVALALPITNKLIVVVLGNASGIGNLILFVFLITFVMAIFASQLFRGEIPQEDEDGEVHRITFSTIFNSFLGMYQILSSENWTDILYSVTAYTRTWNTSWFGAIFLIGWFILSFFILVNMFIAVIQENFDVSEDEKRLEQVKAFLQRKELGKSSGNLALSAIFSLGRSQRQRDPLDYGPAMMEMLLKDTVVKDFLDDAADPQGSPDESQQPTRAPTAYVGDVKPGLLSSIWGRLASAFFSKEPNPFYSNIRFDGPNDALDPRQMARQAVSSASARRKAQREYLVRHPTYNTSLFIFDAKNPFRRLCQRIVGPGRGTERFDGVEPNKITWYIFSAFIYTAVFCMVVLACITTPLYQKQYREEHDFSIKNWYVWTDLAFAVVFTIEAAIKIVADGFFWTPNAYFRSSWGIIDALVLITLWIYVGTLLANDGEVSRAVGAFKALRALRLLNFSNSSRNTFHVIIAGLWKILGAAFVSISLLIPFAIYGLNLFNGLMLGCNDDGDGIERLSQCFGEYDSSPYSSDWPVLAPRVVANPYFSFDDFSSSLFTLFQIVSQEGWVDVSFAAQAITGLGLQPQSFAAQANAVFFVTFNLAGTVFVLTLFISVFMRTYTEQTGVAYLTTEQRSWLELRKLLRQISPSKSSYEDGESRLKKWCHKKAIEKKGKWYTAITFILVCHLILLLFDFQQEPEWWTKTRDGIFLGFCLVYLANIVIRILGLGWVRFRRSTWDLYSLVVVSGAFISTAVLLITNTRLETYVQLHKFFLVAVVLLVIPRNDALDQLFKTAAASLTSIGNLLATWIVFFVMFAIFFTQIFSLTRFGGGEAGHLNFRTVPNALILLFRLSCGEGWNEIMEDYANIEPPLCVESGDFFDSDCGSKAWARALFLAWNVLSMYFFVNLFVSLIYESFSYVYQRSSGLGVVDRDEIRRFKEAWRSVDPAGTGFISKAAFPRLLGELSGVFQIGIYDQADSVRQILEDTRSDTPVARHLSIGTASGYNVNNNSVDLAKLNRRLAEIDIVQVRERRRRFNIFYEEVMVSADPDRGISFTTVLMILAHYNIINDNKSLRLEEFLRRRARLQRVEEEVRRQVVLGFFETLYWSRKFQRHMDTKRAARMTAIPQLDIPDILVDDEDDDDEQGAGGVGGRGSGGGGPSGADSSTQHLRASDALSHARSDSGSSVSSAREGNYQHPLSAPRASLSSSPTQRSTRSAVSFELLDERRSMPGSSNVSRESSTQRNTATSPSRVQSVLDGSVWLESLQKSATVRRPNRGSSRYGG